MYGVDPLQVLKCEDPLELLVYTAVAEHIENRDMQLRQDLASRVARAMAGES